MQQLLSLILQERGLPLADWQQWLGRIPAFLPGPDTAARIVGHLLASGLLWNDEGVLRFDRAGERRYSGRYLPELLSAFASDALMTVVCGRDEIGRVHPLSFVDTGNRPLLLLAGRSWQLQHIDWSAGMAHAIPAEGQGRARWLGNALLSSAAISGEIRQLLHEQVFDSVLSRRAQTRLQDFYAPADAAGTPAGGDGVGRLAAGAGAAGARRRSRRDPVQPTGSVSADATDRRPPPRAGGVGWRMADVASANDAAPGAQSVGSHPPNACRPGLPVTAAGSDGQAGAAPARAIPANLAGAGGVI